MGNDVTSGLDPDKLKRLFEIGTDEDHKATTGDDAEREQKKADILQDLLRSSLPINEVLVQSLPEIIQRVFQELSPLTSESLDKVLLDPGSDVSALERIKRHTKGLTKTASSPTEREAATAVYYMAIASALVFHDKRITKSPYEKLKRSFDKLCNTPWVQPDMIKLLKEAVQMCALHMETKDRD